MRNRLSIIRDSAIAILFASALLLNGCKKKSDTALVRDFRKMDAFLRSGDFDYDSMKIYEAMLNENLVHSLTKELRYEERKATVNYQWNADSTIVLLRTHKVFPKGFNRELIAHVGDSILFVHRFSTEPLGLESKDNFTFLEAVFYLTPSGTIKHLARIAYRQSHLEDTIAFRKKPLVDLTDDISFYYPGELDHSRNILSLN